MLFGTGPGFRRLGEDGDVLGVQLHVVVAHGGHVGSASALPLVGVDGPLAGGRRVRRRHVGTHLGQEGRLLLLLEEQRGELRLVALDPPVLALLLGERGHARGL